MNKLYLTLIIATLLFGIIFVTSADELITTLFSKSISIDKAERDFLLTKVPEISKDVKEIKLNLTISCDAENCNYKATQKGLPTIVGKVTRCSTECLEPSEDIFRGCSKENTVCLDMKGVENFVSEQITNRLEIFAKQNMPLNYTEISKGTITVEEKQ